MKPSVGMVRSSALALTAGAAAALAHPPFGVLPGLFGYGLLLALSDRPDPQRPLASAFWRGWLAGSAYFLIGCWWVAQAFLVDAAEQGWMAPFAILILAGGLGLFWAAACLVYAGFKPKNPLWKVLVFAGSLSAAEWLRGHVLTGFPWNLPGETWVAGSAPSQSAALIGAYGLTWLTVVIAGGLCAPLAFGRSRHSLMTAGACALALAGLYGFGLTRLAHAQPAAADAPLLRIVQADIPQKMLENPASFELILSRYLRLTALPAARRPAIVIWPEGALPISANDTLSGQSWVPTAIAQALTPDQLLLLGAYRIVGAPPAAQYFNSLLAVRRQGEGLNLTTFYDKHRLVPFGEYLPLEALMGRLGIKKLVHVGDGFSSGRPPAPILAPGAPAMQPLICYEALFPGFTRQGAAATGIRARWIVNVSDDAWYGPTSGPWQHLNLASYRAIEEGLPMVRATPTGVSALVDAYGRSPAALRLGLSEQGVIDAPLPLALAPTLYNRYGDMLFGLMLGLSLVAACVRWRPFPTSDLQT